MAVFVAAGLFHGYTYRDSIYGAEAGPDRVRRRPSGNDGRRGVRNAWTMEVVEHGAAVGRRRLLWRRVCGLGCSAHSQLLKLYRNRAEPPVQFISKTHGIVSSNRTSLRWCGVRSTPDFLNNDAVVLFAVAMADTGFQHGGVDFKER